MIIMDYPKTEIILLPDFALTKTFKIPSDENYKKKYQISLNAMTCECSEFLNKASFHNKNDLRRACKHIRRAIVISEIMENSWLRKLIGDRFIYDYYFVPEGEDCAFAYYIGNPWIKYYGKAYTTKKGTKIYYDRFSFSVTEQRWASNAKPMNAFKVESMINKYFPITEEQLKWKSNHVSGNIREVTLTFNIKGESKKEIR